MSLARNVKLRGLAFYHGLETDKEDLNLYLTNISKSFPSKLKRLYMKSDLFSSSFVDFRLLGLFSECVCFLSFFLRYFLNVHALGHTVFSFAIIALSPNVSLLSLLLRVPFLSDSILNDTSYYLLTRFIFFFKTCILRLTSEITTIFPT